MSFIIYELALNPDIQEKCFTELNDVMGNNPDTSCTYTDLINMKYLEMVIKEGVRKYPSVPIVGRQTTENIEVQGIQIPPGIDINILVYAIHRNPKIYPDPLKFNPERFTEEAQKSRGPYDFIPFSAGSRNCIGNYINFFSQTKNNGIAIYF